MNSVPQKKDSSIPTPPPPLLSLSLSLLTFFPLYIAESKIETARKT